MKYQIRTIAEEKITTVEEAGDSPGPLWNYGSPTITRFGNRVYASVSEIHKNSLSLCNMKWRLFSRDLTSGWEEICRGDKFNEREPCPIGIKSDGNILLSINPCIKTRRQLSDGRTAHYCQPKLLVIDVRGNNKYEIVPEWDDEDYGFTEHSYRGLSIDSHDDSVLLLNILGYGGYAWSYLDSMGIWRNNGFIRYPVRSAYPQVALQNKMAVVVSVSDIFEPNLDWRAYKREILKKDWDYDFRQLFFTYTPDITQTDFSAPLTIASVDETAGHIRNMDLWIAENGDVHVLYIIRNIWRNCIKDKYFPDTPITVSLKHCIINNGKVRRRRTLFECSEIIGEKEFLWKGILINYAAFHVTALGELFVIMHLKSRELSGNYIFRLSESISPELQKIELVFPIEAFFLASPRLGTVPSDTIDLFGTEIGWSYEDFYSRRRKKSEFNIRYAQLRIIRK